MAILVSYLGPISYLGPMRDRVNALPPMTPALAKSPLNQSGSAFPGASSDVVDATPFDWKRLLSALEQAVGEAVTIRERSRLAGGALQQNWRLDAVIGGARLDLVLRAEGARIADSLSGQEEFAVHRAAFVANVTVPKPLWLIPDPPCYLMEFRPGSASGASLSAGSKREDLAARLGEELARLHAIRPPRADLGFLVLPEMGAAARTIALCRAILDQGEAHPVLEWGLRWLERHVPPANDLVLCHGDFRTGNYLVEQGELSGILDWEFAKWSDPLEDIGWFCARYWRFAAPERAAGGLADQAVFLGAYQRAGGRVFGQEELRYWEVAANLRWACLAILQGRRFLAGARDIDLALTGRRAAELEWEILGLIGEG